jgi:hypothetical protein
MSAEGGQPNAEIGRGLNKFFAFSPFVEGTYLEALSCAELENVLPSLLKMLRALRAIDLSSTTGFGFWNKDGKGSHDSWRAFLLDDKNESEVSLFGICLARVRQGRTSLVDCRSP